MSSSKFVIFGFDPTLASTGSSITPINLFCPFSYRLAAAKHAGEDLLPKGFNYDKINEIINTSITMPIEKNRFYHDLS